MRGYGSCPGSEVIGLGDWLKVSQSISAIGQTIDLKRQQERQNTIEDQNRQKEEQAAQAFNYFIENPEAMDFDNPEKQTAKPSAIGEVAGVPSERPRLPIEDYSPEAIAKARVAAMSYWTNKKTLSAESLRQTAIKAKQDKDEFIKGISLAATSLASGDEAGAKDAFVSAYNQFYPDAHKMRVNEAGEFIMSSPTGAERNMGKPNMEQMIDEFLGSPAINEKAFAQMSLMNKRAIQEMNRQSLEKPQPLYGQDGKEYFAYAQIDPESKDRTVIVTNMPAGMPGARTLTAEEITGLGLHTEDAVKFKEDRETHSATMGVRSAQENYYNDRGEAALSKGGGPGTEKDQEKKQTAYQKIYAPIVARMIEDAGGIDGMTDQEIAVIRANAKKEADAQMADGGGGAVAEAQGKPGKPVKPKAKPVTNDSLNEAMGELVEGKSYIMYDEKTGKKVKAVVRGGKLTGPDGYEISGQDGPESDAPISPPIEEEPETEPTVGAISQASDKEKPKQATGPNLKGATLDISGNGTIWSNPSGKQPVRVMIKPKMTVFNGNYINPEYLRYLDILKQAGLPLPKEKLPNKPVAKNL